MHNIPFLDPSLALCVAPEYHTLLDAWNNVTIISFVIERT